MEIQVVYHLQQISGNSVWNVNGTHRFGSSQWKIFGLIRNSEKVVLLFPFGNCFAAVATVIITDSTFTAVSGLEIATDTVANATKTLNLATKNSSLVATLATMFLWYIKA